jgi:hypothetical protein
MVVRRGEPVFLTTTESDRQEERLSSTIPPHWPQGESLSMVHQKSIEPFSLQKLLFDLDHFLNWKMLVHQKSQPLSELERNCPSWTIFQT